MIEYREEEEYNREVGYPETGKMDPKDSKDVRSK